MGYLWDYIFVFGLIGVGVYFTIILKFPQISRPLVGLKILINGIIHKEEDKEGKMTAVQAFSTALIGQVASVNILASAIAIGLGGPGAAFWILVSTFFGMATSFAESLLAQKYRQRDEKGLIGGPAYYMGKGLKSKFLAIVFSIACILGLGIAGTMLQSNLFTSTISSTFGVPVISVTVGLAIVLTLILMGGMARIASFAETALAIMTATCILGLLMIIFMEPGNLLPAIRSIFQAAFQPSAIKAGILAIIIQQGIGSSAHSHALADSRHPAEQGSIAILAVFISTLIICISMVMVSMVSNTYIGMLVSIFLAFFSLTTMVVWYFYAESNVRYLINSKSLTLIVFKVLVIVSLVIASSIKLSLIWKFLELSLAIMAIANLVGLLLLSKEARLILDDYDLKEARNMVNWKYEDE